MTELKGQALRRLRLPTVDYTGVPIQLVPAQQGDTNSRFFAITLFDDRGGIDLSPFRATGGFVQLNATLADGSVQHNLGSVEDNAVVCSLTSSMLSGLGRLQCDITLYGKDADERSILLTSQTFYVNVSRSQACNDSVEGDENFNILVSLIEDVRQLEQDVRKSEEQRETAEASRVAAENARRTAESGSVSAENARVNAENARRTAETGRVNAEAARVLAELDRAAAENTRGTAEQTRIGAESARATAESTRVSNEQSRVTAESNRATSESQRITNEQGRVNTESSRVVAENARALSEQGRVTAENTRVTNENTRVANESQRQATFDGHLSEFADVIGNMQSAISNAEQAANEAAILAEDAATAATNAQVSACSAASDAATAQENTTQINARMNRDFVTDANFAVQNNNVVMRQDNINPVTNTSFTVVKGIPIANATANGLMPREAVSALSDLELRMAAQEAGVASYAVTIPNNPTQAQLQALFIAAAGVPTGTRAPDLTKLTDPSRGIFFQWSVSANRWNGPFNENTSIATNKTLGLVKGNEDIDGKVYVEPDGSMSLVGWNELNALAETNEEKIDNHMANRNNPHRVTASQVGAEPAIPASGLPIARGGTGATTQEAARRNLDPSQLIRLAHFQNFGVSTAGIMINIPLATQSSIYMFRVTARLGTSNLANDNTDFISLSVAFSKAAGQVLSAQSVRVVPEYGTMPIRARVGGNANSAYLWIRQTDTNANRTATIYVHDFMWGQSTAAQPLVGDFSITRTDTTPNILFDQIIDPSIPELPEGLATEQWANQRFITQTNASTTFAPLSHNHNASNINAGTLPIDRGGTGGANRQAAMASLFNIDIEASPNFTTGDIHFGTFRSGHHNPGWLNFNRLRAMLNIPHLAFSNNILTITGI